MAAGTRHHRVGAAIIAVVIVGAVVVVVVVVFVGAVVIVIVIVSAIIIVIVVIIDATVVIVVIVNIVKSRLSGVFRGGRSQNRSRLSEIFSPSVGGARGGWWMTMAES